MSKKALAAAGALVIVAGIGLFAFTQSKHMEPAKTGQPALVEPDGEQNTDNNTNYPKSTNSQNGKKKKSSSHGKKTKQFRPYYAANPYAVSPQSSSPSAQAGVQSSQSKVVQFKPVKQNKQNKQNKPDDKNNKSDKDQNTHEDNQPPKEAPFSIGLAANSDVQYQIPRAASLGVKVLRVEWSTSDGPSALASTIDLAASYGITIQPLIGWDNGILPPDITVVADWAASFGPGGTHWQGKTNVQPITEIELGNENSYTYKSGSPSSEHYQDIAAGYGHRALQAAQAVKAANPKVGVLVELEDANTGTTNWIDGVLGAGGQPLIDLMDGPTIHPYGDDMVPRINRNWDVLAAHGVNKPFYITEWGFASDDGVNLYSSNYYDYADAGAALTSGINFMKTSGKVQQVMVYQASDQRYVGTLPTNREHYFGIVKVDGSPKGSYTSSFKTLVADNP